MLGFTLLTTTMLAGLLWAEWRGSIRARWATKPLASLGFVGVAWSGGATESTYGWWILAALVLSWLGDVLLIYSDSPPAFRAGLFSFLLGHLAFALGFISRGQALAYTVVAVVVLSGVLIPVLRWLGPKLADEMRVPVYLYMVVISLMVALALGTHASHPGLSICVGALMFYFSDLAVARDRFVNPGFVNRLWGLPLYYGAQLLLASTVAMG